MIFGKKDIDTKQWHEVFIILPRRLIDGRWAMFHWVERCDYMALHIPVGVPNSFFGWCYREIQYD